MMASKPALRPHNETEHSVSRITQAGKKITYNLKVIQQPERARACGAGAKSSADRRPVDPPPVVELRIFESDPNNDFHRTDITFGYNANFFLFPTLEWARPMAHGRVQVQPPACPVLTGMAVAGIAYLDRPTQAGYFIFPDLSVRHEGMYRLNFNLYEEVKDPKDLDKGVSPPVQDNMVASSPTKPRTPNRFLQFRLEVKSTPFQVYSAKKFPGLSESTQLSQVVAEQGCRVRIRRDVRMRRREQKPAKDFVYDNRHITPDIYPGTPVERPRSTSNASMDDPYRYGASPHGPPGPEYAYHHTQYQNAHVPPPPGMPGPPAPQSHLSFGAAQTQYQAPPPPPAPPSAVPSSALPSPHPAYSHMRQTSAGSEYDQQVPKYPRFSPRPPVDMNEQQAKASLPPLSIPAASPRTDSVHTPSYHSTDPKAYHSTPRMAPAAQTPRTPIHNLAPSMPPPQPLAVDEPATPVSANGHNPIRAKGWTSSIEPVGSKRSHSAVFGDSEHDQPLHDGRRPDSLHNPSTNSGKRDSENFGPDGKASGDAMVYHRADGTVATRFNAANAAVHPA